MGDTNDVGLLVGVHCWLSTPDVCSEEVCIRKCRVSKLGWPSFFGCLEYLTLTHPVSRMRRCLYELCDNTASFQVEGGSKTPAYCKQHAQDGMVDVHNKRCSHASCLKHPNFNVTGSKTRVYCKQHAESNMVNISKKRCSHESCSKFPNFNFIGKVPVYCKQHAGDGMVNVVSKKCFHDACTKRPCFNTPGSQMGLYCKQHAEHGMVYVLRKSCSHDSCMKLPTFNMKGSKKAAYCKQHAEDGMIDVISKRCAHDLCNKYPNYNVAGSKMAVSCKQHAEDGMVNVMGKRCFDDACTRRPNFNIEGSKTGVFCKQHAAEGMVNVCSRRCSYIPCARRASVCVKGGKMPVYCKHHAEEGMVDVRIGRHLNDYRTTRPARDVPTNVAATAPIRHTSDILDGSLLTSAPSSKVVGCRKRARLELDGTHPSLFLGDIALKEEISMSMVIDPGTGCPRTPFPHPSYRYRGRNTVATTNKLNNQYLPGNLVPLPSGHPSGEPIKNEMNVAVIF